MRHIADTDWDPHDAICAVWRAYDGVLTTTDCVAILRCDGWDGARWVSQAVLVRSVRGARVWVAA